jgi:anti-anti-sigma factor
MADLNDGGASFDVAPDEDGATVTIRGELDVANVDALDAAVAPVIDGGAKRLVLDVRELRFADSSAIALWLRWAAEVDEFELRDPPPLLRKVIASMGLAARLKLAK